jgi:hypothetical protein
MFTSYQFRIATLRTRIPRSRPTVSTPVNHAAAYSSLKPGTLPQAP